MIKMVANNKFASLAITVSILTAFLSVASLAKAATTIGTNINTAGTFKTSGEAAFGNASLGIDPTADFAGDTSYDVGITGDYTFTGTSSEAMALRTVLNPSVTPFLGAGFGLETEIASGNAQDFTSVNGLGSSVVHFGSGSTNSNGLYTTALDTFIGNEGGGTIPNAWPFNAQINNDSGHIPEAAGYHVDTFHGLATDISMTGTYDTIYSFWSGAQTAATNNYYSWFDSRGVRRVKEDSTVNGTGQAIEALYNNQFTKYTPGATDYERLVLGEWNSSNVAEIGTENGGTGSARALALITASTTRLTIGATGRVGISTTTPVANFQVANGSNATTTMELGSSGQNKGSCLKLYRTDGSAIYAYIAAGATTFTLTATATACASVSNF